VLTGHVKQAVASLLQEMQVLGQFKQDVALFPAGLLVPGEQKTQTPLLR
jgi:hypothetical protein